MVPGFISRNTVPIIQVNTIEESTRENNFNRLKKSKMNTSLSPRVKSNFKKYQNSGFPRFSLESNSSIGKCKEIGEDKFYIEEED